MEKLSRLSFAVASLATVFYCIVAWYAGNFFAILSGDVVSNYSRVAVGPLDLPLGLNMIHWQLMAVASLAASLVLAVRNHAASSLLIANHYGVLLLFLLINLSGIASSTVAIAYVIE